MQVDAGGTLVDLSGNPVLGESGPITFDQNDTDITIADNGAISSSQGSKGKLAVVEFVDPQSLAREGDNYYSALPGSPRRRPGSCRDRSSAPTSRASPPWPT